MKMTDPYQQRKNPQRRKEVNAAAGIPADKNLIAKKVTRALWIFATALDVLLGFRFLLKLFAANPASPFARLVYTATDVLVFPFQNLVSNPAIGNGVFETTTVVAILFYIFLTWLAIQLAILIFKR
jgi:hypothetical protein